MNLPHLAQRLFNVPLAIAPEKAQIIVSALGGRFGVDFVHEYDAKVATSIRADDNAGYAVEHGIGIIPVTGTLVHKTGNLRPESGMTGYDGIRHNFMSALNDPKVNGICLDIDSPGGEVAGCFDLSEYIFKSRGTKPVMAILSDMAFYSSYLLFSP